MKYLKTFQNHSDYETYMSGDVTLPNISYCENNDDWMLKHVTERIQFFRQKKFNYKFYSWINMV